MRLLKAIPIMLMPMIAHASEEWTQCKVVDDCALVESFNPDGKQYIDAVNRNYLSQFLEQLKEPNKFRERILSCDPQSQESVDMCVGLFDEYILGCRKNICVYSVGSRGES